MSRRFGSYEGRNPNHSQRENRLGTCNGEKNSHRHFCNQWLISLLFSLYHPTLIYRYGNWFHVYLEKLVLPQIRTLKERHTVEFRKQRDFLPFDPIVGDRLTEPAVLLARLQEYMYVLSVHPVRFGCKSKPIWSFKRICVVTVCLRYW